MDHLEVERKFEVGAGFELPGFGGVPGYGAVSAPARFRLSATYFDTPDTRLADAGVTLRRRTGGPDEGWHLKLPAGQDARRELHEPLGEDATRVPARLAARVAQVAGPGPLAPIAILDTERTVITLTAVSGEALAEIADDVVTARRAGPAGSTGEPMRWREVEVELAEPPAAAGSAFKGSAALSVPGAAGVLDAVARILLAAGARPAGKSSKLARLLGTR